MKLKCTALGSYVMTAKPSQRGNDDSEVKKFKDFQGPLTSNSKTFKALFHFQGLSRSWKNGKKFSRTFKACGHPVHTMRCVNFSTSLELQKIAQHSLVYYKSTHVTLLTMHNT